MCAGYGLWRTRSAQSSGGVGHDSGESRAHEARAPGVVSAAR